MVGVRVGGQAEDASSGTVRTALLVGMGFIFVTGLALPRAFKVDTRCCSSSTYAVVRFLHLGALRRCVTQGQRVVELDPGFSVTVTIGMALLLVGAFLHDGRPRRAVGGGARDRLRGPALADA